MRPIAATIFLSILLMSAGGAGAQCDTCVVDSVGFLPLVPAPRPYECKAESYNCAEWEDCIRYSVGGGSIPKPEFYFFIYGGAMTGIANNAFMAIFEFEFRLPVVVELPETPAVWIMAASAVFAQT